MPPQQVFPIFLGNGESMCCKLNFFSCGSFVHEKHFQIATAALGLKLDKGRVHLSTKQKLTYLFNHEDDIEPQQNFGMG